MLQIIRAFLKTEYTKVSDGEKKHDKKSASLVAGKLVLLFFAAMLVFTVISRAAEAVTLASVRVESPRADRLSYQVTGKGIVAKAEDEYLNVVPGYRIDKVMISAGDPVTTDTILFSYKEEDLLERSSSIEKDIARLKLQIQQQQLNATSSETTTTQAPLLTLKQAEDSLKAAKERLAEAEQEYQDDVSKTKMELLKDKKEEYARALKNYEATLLLQEKELKLSLRTLEDAKSAYTQTIEVPDQIKQLIENYITAVNKEDSLSIYNAKEAIFEYFYGDKEAYEEHKDNVYETALAMQWDKEGLMMLQYLITYYSNLMSTTLEELQNAVSSTDPILSSEEYIRQKKERYELAKLNYLEKLKEYEGQLTLMSNSMLPSSNELQKLRRNDIKLDQCLTALQKSVKESGDEEASKELTDLLLGDKAKPMEKENTAKKLTLDRAQEDYELLIKENENTKKELLEELEELNTTILSMEDGTYDYESALEGKKQAVASAKEAIRVAEQAVEVSKLQYNAALQNDENTAALTEKNKKSLDLALQGYQLDLETKEAELSEVKKLLESSGEILSPWEGIVTSIDLEEGKITTGGELVKIGTGKYIYRAEFDGEMVGYAEPGGKLDITLAGEKNSFEAEISEVRLNETGMAVLTAILPEREYILGESADFKITKESDRFELCIPIQAVREDNYGKFVYVTREQDTILGTELIAYRVNIEVLKKNNYTAAVQGPLSPKDKVITDSSKYIKNMDRVRVK